MVDIKEVSNGEALRLWAFRFPGCIFGKPHKRIPFSFFFFNVSITSGSIALLQKQNVILSTVLDDFTNM